MRNVAVVVIPVYKEILSETERVSLAQVQRVLGTFDMCFLAPSSLDVCSLVSDNDIRVERMEDRFFMSKNTYSEMMLLPELYERFSDYEYLLLYQLDAFVFSNRLEEFCSMGYDYIGAPHYSWAVRWRDVGCGVGVGGFSLRKVDSTIRVLHQKEQIFRRMPKNWTENEFLRWEDLFFAFCSTIPELDFHVPDFHTALDFAVGLDIGHAYRKMPAWMPFGCHAWNLIDYWHWKPLIERCGYQLPVPRGRQSVHQRLRQLDIYASERILRGGGRHSDAGIRAAGTCLPKEKGIVLWGGGVYGKHWMSLLLAMRRQPEIIFDRNPDAVGGQEHVRVVPPDIRRLASRKFFVIVTTLKYEDEICGELAAHGFVESIDYVRMTTMMRQMLREYVKSFCDDDEKLWLKQK